jgi:uncharacterized protein (TIGR03435 family)
MRTLQGSWSLKNVNIAFLANRLARQLGRTVVDRTDLKGQYDMKLEWARGAGAGEGTSPSSDSDSASIFTAIQETRTEVGVSQGTG